MNGMLPFQPHSATSREAAVKKLPRALSDRWIVFLQLGEVGDQGLADHEIQERLVMSGSTQRPRRVELYDKQLVRNTGLRVQTQSGGSAFRWALTEKGKALFKWANTDEAGAYSEFVSRFSRKKES